MTDLSRELEKQSQLVRVDEEAENIFKGNTVSQHVVLPDNSQNPGEGVSQRTHVNDPWAWTML